MSLKTILQNGPTHDLKDGHFNGKTKIEQFFHYKYNNRGMDFDAIKPIVEVYCQTFESLHNGKLVHKGGKNYNIVKDNLVYTGETMNSGLNILKKAMHFSPGYTENYKKISVSGSFSTRKNIKKFIEHLDDFYIEANCENLNDFLGLTHSIGNFIPVPQGFNVGRNLLTSDYWDLALYNIYLWYATKNDDYLNRFLIKKDINVIENIKLWLNSFKNWQGFIEKNYLQPFVLHAKDSQLRPIPFWDDHFNRYEDYHSKKTRMTKKLALEPQNTEEINQFLERVNRRITSRGN